MLALRHLRERKWWLLLIVAGVYCVLYHFAGQRLWKDGVHLPERTLSSTKGLLAVFRNSKQLSSQPVISIDGPIKEATKTTPLVAIGCAITSNRLVNVSENNIGKKFQFFHTFLPTFCRTASQGFIYKFYLAYDRSDKVFANHRLREAFHGQFSVATSSGSCADRGVTTNLSLVECDHAGKPTWAQNDAMLDAYLDHVDYFYRINDDTKMFTGGWTEKFITTLKSYDPALVGVVGPNHSGGNTAILTYDFMHRTHVDIFGFYYPRLFTDWWGDDWVTRVYKPKRSTKIHEVRLAHTLGLGQRYQVHFYVAKHLGEQLAHDAAVLNRYITAIKSNEASGVKPDGRKVISMSLYGKDPRYTWGVLRNAQLLPVYLPDWTLRVYVADDPAASELAVPPRMLNKLRLLGAKIARVSTGNTLQPRNWRLLVANDQQVDYFLVRDADSRLSEREAAAIRDWLSVAEKNGSESVVVHCIRDHPKHTEQAIVDGLWGGRPRALHQLLRQDITQMMDTNSSDGVVRTLNQVLWPAVKNFSYCHDSVSPCDRWTPSTSRRPFPLARQGREYIGQKFDAHHQLISKDGTEPMTYVMC